MDWIPPFYQDCDKQISLYCIRCGKAFGSSEVHYSKDDPDHEEPLCHSCYERNEKFDKK